MSRNYRKSSWVIEYWIREKYSFLCEQFYVPWEGSFFCLVVVERVFDKRALVDTFKVIVWYNWSILTYFSERHSSKCAHFLTLGSRHTSSDRDTEHIILNNCYIRAPSIICLVTGNNIILKSIGNWIQIIFKHGILKGNAIFWKKI